MPGIAFPETVETSRLQLRRCGPGDVVRLLALVEENRAMLQREFPQMAALYTVEEVEQMIALKDEHWSRCTTFCYLLWHLESGALVGYLQVKNITWEIPAAELGYFIAGRWQRQGFASESIRVLVRIAMQRLGFQRIFVRILPGNQESLALARKLGFQDEGLFRKAYRCGRGQLHDVRVLSLIKE